MQLQQQVQNRDQAIQALQQQVSQAQSAAQAAQQAANAAVPKAEDLDKQYIDPLQHQVADLSSVSANTVNGVTGDTEAGCRSREPAGHSL